MSCLKTKYKADCGCKESPCSDENLAYLTSQEMADKIIANVTISSLSTANKTIPGAIAEIDSKFNQKQDHHTNLDYLSTGVTQKQIEDTIQALQVIK